MAIPVTLKDYKGDQLALPRPARRKGSGPIGLELRLMWGDQMVGEYFLHPGKPASFSVGAATGVDFVMGDSRLGGPKLDVVTAGAEGFELHFTGKMQGELDRHGEVKDLEHLIESGAAFNDGGTYNLPLEADDFAWLDLGAVHLEVSFQPAPKPVLVPFTDTMDFNVLNIFLVMFFLATLFVITAMNRDAEGDELADELNNSQMRIAKLIIKPPELQKNPLIERLAQQKTERASGEMAAKHRGDEGPMGKGEAKERDAHAAPRGDPSNKDQARALAAELFSSGKGGISTVFGPGGLGGELRSAMGSMFGSAPGDAHGLGGLGLRGSNAGGGGLGDTLGIGAIGTRGRGGGTDNYGSDGVGVLGVKKVTDIIDITPSNPEVIGSLDKELIRQVIHSHRNQIRYCYESQLNRFPKLAGKVAVKFVISGAGAVASSQVPQSTVGNAELETCVASRVRTWSFPKPKGGGIVVVTYPFIFKQSGE